MVSEKKVWEFLSFCKVVWIAIYKEEADRCSLLSPSTLLSWGKEDFWVGRLKPRHAEELCACCSTLLLMLPLSALFLAIEWIHISEFSLFSKSNPTIPLFMSSENQRPLRFLQPLCSWQIGYWFSSIESTSQGQPNYFYSRKQKVPVNLIGSFQVLQRFC